MVAPYGSLPIACNQTFGVEIELTAPGGVPWPDDDWKTTGQRILDRLADAGVQGVHSAPIMSKHAPDSERWHLVYDASAGWEVVSPVLWNAEGFEQLRLACNGLTALVAEEPGLTANNYQCGLHITLGTRLNTDERLCGFLRRVQRLEPGLCTLVAPSRLYAFDGSTYDRHHRNHYCRPLREAGELIDEIDLADFAAWVPNRYHSVNVTKAYENVQKLEVRMHGGTTEYRKVALWLSLWMQIFNHSRYSWMGPSAWGSVLPGGNTAVGQWKVEQEDLLHLLQQEDIHLDRGLEAALRQRRAELRPVWEAAVPQRVGSWNRAGWYDLSLWPVTETPQGLTKLSHPVPLRMGAARSGEVLCSPGSWVG
jgi:hypothetical protein